MSNGVFESQVDVVVERYVVDSFLSNTYLIYEQSRTENEIVIVVDPHFTCELEKRLVCLKTNLVYIALTHEHYDHTTGINWLLSNYDCKIVCHSDCGKKIANKRNNRPLSIMSQISEAKKYMYEEPKAYNADIVFEKELLFECFGGKIKFVHTPGHTSGSSCIEVGRYRFTGDSMLLNTPVITRFPTGSEEEYQKITLPYLIGISEECIIAPGHGAMFAKKDVRLSKDYYVEK